MKKLFIFIAVSSFSVFAQAEMLRFNCAAADMQQLQTEFDESQFTPDVGDGFSDFEFIFNGKTFSWTDVLVFSGELNNGKFMTMVQLDYNNTFYLELDADGKEARAEVFLAGKKTDFACQVSR